LRLQAGPDGTLAAAAIADRHGEIVLHRQLGPEVSADATCFADERSLLGALIQRLVTKDPDLIIGWNLLSEDVPLLREAARRCRMSLPLAQRARRSAIPSRPWAQTGASRAVLSGRVIFDVAPAVATCQRRGSRRLAERDP
jgi:DNA polymerase elongation subunit (family B)